MARLPDAFIDELLEEGVQPLRGFVLVSENLFIVGRIVENRIWFI